MGPKQWISWKENTFYSPKTTWFKGLFSGPCGDCRNVRRATRPVRKPRGEAKKPSCWGGWKWCWESHGWIGREVFVDDIWSLGSCIVWLGGDCFLMFWWCAQIQVRWCFQIYNIQLNCLKWFIVPDQGFCSPGRDVFRCCMATLVFLFSLVYHANTSKSSVFIVLNLLMPPNVAISPCCHVLMFRLFQKVTQ